METSLRVLRAKHPFTLSSMGNLASIYSDQGRWKEAKELDVQVMEGLRAVERGRRARRASNGDKKEGT
ncbi:hypothetical protein V2W45_1338235 [Cenococcum geophilum]